MTQSESTTGLLFQDRENLAAIEADCWELLDRAVHDRACGWRLPVLGTFDERGIRQRIVVLRAVDTTRRKFFVHTDVRSAKVEMIREFPEVSWLFYDSARQVQMQMTGTATVLTEKSETDWLWNQESTRSLRSYLAPHTPGTVCRQPNTNLPSNVRERIPEREELSAGREKFAVIQAEIKTMECVLLGVDGNLRTRFVFESGECVQRDWLCP